MYKKMRRCLFGTVPLKRTPLLQCDEQIFLDPSVDQWNSWSLLAEEEMQE